MQHAGAAGRDRGGVPTGLDPVAAGLEADQAHVGVVEERVEDADRVRAAADARRDDVGQATDQVEHLLARLHADDALQVPDHPGERVRPGDGAEHVVGGLDVGDPVAQGLVDRVLERARSRRDGDDLGAQQAHPRDVEGLPAGVLLAHVHHAVEVEQRGRRGRGHPVLTRAGLGDHSGLADPLGEQRLAEHVVDLVRARVVEVLALEDDACPAGVRSEPGHLGDDARPTRVRPVQPGELADELRIDLGLLVLRVELVERRDQRLRDEPAPELPEVRARTRRQRLAHTLVALLHRVLLLRVQVRRVQVRSCSGQSLARPRFGASGAARHAATGATPPRRARPRTRGGRRLSRAPPRRAPRPHPDARTP